MKSVAVPILMYHQVTPTPHAGLRKLTLTPNEFAAQMKWLHRAGYHPITPDHLLEYRAGRKDVPSSPVIITFDDGYRDCFTYAVPILRAYGFPAIFFIVAGLVGKGSLWMAQQGLDLPLMDWNDLAQLRECGFECGSHTLTHPHLPEVPIGVCREELAGSRRILEDHLGCQIRHLAYPFGFYSDIVRDLSDSAGYASAYTTDIGLSSNSDNRLALHRVPVNGGESLFDFACRLAWGITGRDLYRRGRERVHCLLEGVRESRNL